MDPGAMALHIRQLSEIIERQQAARRQDWAEFRTREASLVAEVRELRARLESGACAFEEAGRAEEQALREARSQEQLPHARQHAEDARAMQGSLLASAELRELQRQANQARRGEDQALRLQFRTEEKMESLERELRRRQAECELQAQSREAEVLGGAWQLSGELRSELEASGRRPRQPRGRTVGSDALEALSDLRSVRERYNRLLND